MTRLIMTGEVYASTTLDVFLNQQNQMMTYVGNSHHGLRHDLHVLLLGEILKFMTFYQSVRPLDVDVILHTVSRLQIKKQETKEKEQFKGDLPHCFVEEYR